MDRPTNTYPYSEKSETMDAIGGNRNESATRSTLTSTDDPERQHDKTTNTCEFCGSSFASRNQMFKHLRDSVVADGSATTVSKCGRESQQSNQVLECAPSVVKKAKRKAAFVQAKQEQQERALRRQRQTKTDQQHPSAIIIAEQQKNSNNTHGLWIGDLPLPWTRYGSQFQRLRALLRAHLPRTVRQPWIKLVQRKAYRTKLVVNLLQQQEQQQKPNGDSEGGGVYLGYAIVMFRDDLECDIVLRELNGREISVESVFEKGDLASSADFEALSKAGVPPFTIKVRPLVDNKTNNPQSLRMIDSNASDPSKGVSSVELLDPPLVDQMRPLSTEQLLLRCGNDSGCELDKSQEPAAATDSVQCVATASGDKRPRHSVALQRSLDAIETRRRHNPRQELLHEGRLIPDELRDRLLTILKSLRWAVPNHRGGGLLTCERYLVLLTNVKNEDAFYQDLRDACRDLLNWADPDFYYSGTAVTKNFVSSPHVDDRDQTFQYAVSLGDFTTGGELCVDGWDASTVQKKEKEPVDSFDRKKETDDNDDGDNSFEDKDVLHVVNTHNRIARIDGRFVHWVRPWQDGDRYSLVFYDTSHRHPTPLLPTGIDGSWYISSSSCLSSKKLSQSSSSTTR